MIELTHKEIFMSQTILLEPNEKLHKLYSINLSTYALTDIVKRDNAADVISLLSILPEVDLIITRANIENDLTAVRIFNHIQENDLDIPMIVLGDSKELSQKVLTLKNDVDWEILIKHAANILGVTPEEIQKKSQPKFASLATTYFYEISHTPCDVYIRLKKTNGEYNFVKRLHAQDGFDYKDIQKYEQQGLKYFYIPSDYQQYFVNFVTNSIIEALEKDITLNERLNVNSTGFEIVKDRILEAGFDESVTELAKKCIQSMIMTIQESPSLSSLLKQILSNRIGFAYQHAHLTCVFGDFILSKTPRYEQKHLEIFAFASFFSDITLKTPEQVRINSLNDLNNSSLSDEEKSLVLNHAKDACELLSNSSLINKEILQVINHQHGSLDGVGFSQVANDEVGPIAKVFIIANAFVKIMLDPASPKSKKDILSILYVQFDSPSYHKIIKVLETKIN